MLPDWRTDNWAGQRDVGRDPANWHYQRYQGEFAPYHRHVYEPDDNVHGISPWAAVVFALLFCLVLMNLGPLKECLTNMQGHTIMMFDLLKETGIQW
jgi:hypothetical protein